MSYKYCFYVNRENPLNLKRILIECHSSDVIIVSANEEIAYMAVRLRFLGKAASVDCDSTLHGMEVSENWGSSRVFFQEYSGQYPGQFRFLTTHGWRFKTILRADIKQVSKEVEKIRGRILLGHKVKVYQL